MPDLDISNPEGFLYIVADSHLDEHTAPVSEFLAMLKNLDKPHTLVCLGDLFKIWLAPPKFWTKMHFEVMEALTLLKNQGCNVVFVAGNREMLLPKKLNKNWQLKLPFTHLTHLDWYLNWGNQSYGFIHGDTLNTQDLQYLRWKAISHSLPFESFFRALPGPMARWLSERIEAQLVHSNQEYKIEFPETEILNFAEKTLSKVDQFFVGHFHTDRVIQTPENKGILRMVPDWLSQRCVLQINATGETQTIFFK